jgi:methyl-accepting chemotaxis protein WspA
MRNWTIRQRVLSSFALILGLMGVMAVVALQRLAQIGEHAEELRADSLVGLQMSSQIVAATLTSYALTQEHVISLDVPVMDKIQQKLERGRAQLERLLADYATVGHGRDASQRIEALKSALEPFARMQDKALVHSRALRNEEANALVVNDLTPEFQRVERTAQELFDYNKLRAEQSRSARRRSPAQFASASWPVG